MLNDYTLLIPTYNRSGLLGALLRFLAAEGADFPILVLDSSKAEHRTRNKVLAAQSNLNLDYVEYNEGIHPFDKFRDGIYRIRTPLGSLCADDDLVLVDGVRRCVRHLSENPDVCVAHGYYFSFVDQGPSGIDLTSMLYFTPGIDHEEPLWRLRMLFRSYQALTYGIYRTPVLQSVFDEVQPVQSLLGRELLSGALSVVRGKVARLKCFYGGRSQNPSENYHHWHPLEWLIENPGEFFSEYARYREILLKALAQAPARKFCPAETQRLVDLIHAFYMIAHAPREAHDFILDRVMTGDDLRRFWSDPAIQIPLVMAHYGDEITCAQKSRLSKWARWVVGRLLCLSPRMKRHSTDEATIWPKTVRTPGRIYRMHKNFLDCESKGMILTGPDDINGLLASLDRYVDGS